VSVVTIGGLDSVAQATKLVQEQMGFNISVQTVRKVLKAVGLKARAKTKKSLLQQKNVRAHLRFSEEHKNWIVED
jgi:outer membrane biogenesis lipoprotein LolB